MQVLRLIEEENGQAQPQLYGTTDLSGRITLTGQLNGWRFHRDGIHLNSRNGKLLADLVQEFLSTGAGV